MVRNLAKRLGQLALLTVVLFGAVLALLFLRGMYYVQPTADNWRLLPYIVPAASYEQHIYSAKWFDGQQERAFVSISCKDKQGREIRDVTLHEGYLLPIYSDTVYEGNTQTDYFKGWGNYGVQRIVTDAQGRNIRYDYADGSYAVMEYEGDNEEYSLSHHYDAQGTLTSRRIQTWDGNTKYVRDEDGAGNPEYEILYTLDERGNILSAQSTGWRAGVPETDTEQYKWEYDDANRLEICTREDGQIDRRWRDEQGREIRYEAETDGDINTFYHTYTDITRR